MCGAYVQSQAGQNTETASDFMCRGGMLIRSRSISPRLSRFEVVADRVDVPVRREHGPRLDHLPGRRDEQA